MNISVPRVEIPGLTEDDKTQIESLHEEMDWYTRTKQGYLRALLVKGGPLFTGKAKPRRKPTKHQRHMETVKLRSAYLKRDAA